MFRVHPSQEQKERQRAAEANTYEIAGLLPSEFTHHFMRMPVRMVDIDDVDSLRDVEDLDKEGPSEKASVIAEEPGLEKFSFKGRPYLDDVYNTKARKTLLLCARQTEKTTSLGNQMMTYACMRHHFKSLYISPTETQTTTFSRDRISSPIKLSGRLQYFKGSSPTFADNVMYKEFITGSSITLRYAYLHADRARGVFADLLCVDELQDILADIIPVIEQVLSHSPYQILRYAGTPKSLDNTIAYYWERHSTMCEWVIPCDACNHWNIPAEKNIGLTHLICEKCGKQIYPCHDRAQWASMRSPEWLRNPPLARPFEGRRIPQIITPWIDWDQIQDNRKQYTRAKFINEVLGQAYDHADKLLTREKLRPNCTDRPMELETALKYKGRTKLYMGIDWGGGSEQEEKKSFTLLTVGGYLAGQFHYIYFKRYEGADADEDVMMGDIIRLAHQFGISILGTDFGGGHIYNARLIREFGLKRVSRYQYVGTKLLYFDKSLARWMLNRTEGLMALVNALTSHSMIRLPRWADIELPFMADLLSLFAETAEYGRKTVISKSPGAADDTVHAMLYCLLASMIHYPRPDIITPVGPG